MSKKKIVSCLLIAFLLITLAPAPSVEAAQTERNILRIGLKYGSTALLGANAFAEYGYQIGYYDENFSFHQIFTTSERFISFLKDRTLYRIGNEIFSVSGGQEIGAYHLELQLGFSSEGDVNHYRSSLGALASNSFPAYSNGTYRLRIGSYATAQAASDAIPEIAAQLPDPEQLQVVGENSRCLTVVNMNTGDILYEFEDATHWPAAMPIQQGGDQIMIKNGSIRYYGAFEYQRIGDNVNLISVVTMQDYLKGVICFEMSNTWPLEALKTQAICARGYAARNFGKHSSDGFDLCSSTHCQVYKINSTLESAQVAQAVDETNGMVVTYNGSLAETLYSASTPGHTESNSYVWGTTAYPYLQSVEDTWQSDVNNWDVTLTRSQLAQKTGMSNLVNIKVLEYSPGGYAYRLQLIGEDGTTKEIKTADKIRTTLGLKSAGFQITGGAAGSVSLFAQGSGGIAEVPSQSYAITGSGTYQVQTAPDQLAIQTSEGVKTPVAAAEGSGDSFRFVGKGYGHGVGMSQWGANGMAKNGFTYDQILKHYYTDTQITVRQGLAN